MCVWYKLMIYGKLSHTGRKGQTHMAHGRGEHRPTGTLRPRLLPPSALRTLVAHREHRCSSTRTNAEVGSLPGGTARHPGGRSLPCALDGGHASVCGRDAFLSRAVESKHIREVDLRMASSPRLPPETAASAAATALRMARPSPEPPRVRRSRRADTESKGLSPLSSDHQPPRTEARRMTDCSIHPAFWRGGS